MRQINDKLSLEERTLRDDFFNRLNPTDKIHVESVINVVNNIAKDYFRDVESDAELRMQSEDGYRGEPDENYWAFRMSRPDAEEEMGCAFFSVYAIGGQITKEGRRPDIDLMVVTNMWWSGGYINDDEEWFYGTLQKALGNNYEIFCEDDLPNHYNEGLTKNKALIRLTPKDNDSTPIDIVYVRSLPRGKEDDKFINPEEFEQKDVDEGGNQLPRLLIYRASTTDIIPPSFQMSW